MRLKTLSKVFFILCLAASATAVVYGAWMFVSFRRTGDLAVVSSGPNAVWARHLWVGQPRSARQYRAFFDNLKLNNITDVYFHVGPWKDGEGGIPPEKYKHAMEMLAAANRMYPELRTHAWIGQITTPGGPLNLADVEVRKNIASKARVFLDMGFDGVHYDFEPVYNGDTNFIDLLKRTRAVAKKGEYVSVASGQLVIVPREIELLRPITPNSSLWREEYFLEVANYADQIAVMSYDTGMPFDWIYGAYVRTQTSRLARLLRGKTTLLMGAPTYGDRTAGHNPDAEDIRSALKGIGMGLAMAGEDSAKDVGVAIYAEWTTQADEWETWRTMRKR